MRLSPNSSGDEFSDAMRELTHEVLSFPGTIVGIHDIERKERQDLFRQLILEASRVADTYAPEDDPTQASFHRKTIDGKRWSLLFYRRKRPGYGNVYHIITNELSVADHLQTLAMREFAFAYGRKTIGDRGYEMPPLPIGSKTIPEQHGVGTRIIDLNGTVSTYNIPTLPTLLPPENWQPTGVEIFDPKYSMQACLKALKQCDGDSFQQRLVIELPNTAP